MNDDNPCCPDQSDCFFQVDNERLGFIKSACDGKERCDEDLRVVMTGPFTCRGDGWSFSDYEVADYNCGGGRQCHYII